MLIPVMDDPGPQHVLDNRQRVVLQAVRLDREGQPHRELAVLCAGRLLQGGDRGRAALAAWKLSSAEPSMSRSMVDRWYWLITDW